MIHDLELTTVVDAQGVLTPVFSDEDNKKLDENIEMIERSLIQFLYERIDLLNYQSSKLAIIEVAKMLNANEVDLNLLTKKYLNEL